MALPARLITQKLRGMMGRPARRVAQACSTQRTANISAPRNPTSFHGVTTMPKTMPITSLITELSLVLAYQQPRLETAPQPHHARDIDDAHPQPVQHPVLRRAACARAMTDRHGNHARTMALEQRRQETVHVIETRQ